MRVRLRYCRVLVSALLISVTLGVVPCAARQLQAPVARFIVAYDHLDSKLERALAGILEIDRESLRFRAENHQVTWTIPLDTIESIRIEEIITPVKMRVRTVVIESREGNTDIRRRIVPVDEDLRFVSPVVLSGVMKERWRRVSDERRTVTARQR